MAAKQQCFWLARRRPSVRATGEGTDIFLSLIGLSIRPVNPKANLPLDPYFLH